MGNLDGSGLQLAYTEQDLDCPSRITKPVEGWVEELLDNDRWGI